ncbi:hypothetical protein LS73_008205 [Helicobacter muridarum]|uniref:Uncharacterized protein n=1 Tax=Helicobacter muridarum TaxID=216 RepID=A0A099U0R9_9HELI|nr:hypothetical protein [Helicobacter muridarum]TLD98798.1 hypothetical protein LS73_008205 [Helicobacter muridarum]STQ85775.1 Uncharacterised protein [Helicobacter muridarum]
MDALDTEKMLEKIQENLRKHLEKLLKNKEYEGLKIDDIYTDYWNDECMYVGIELVREGK